MFQSVQLLLWGQTVNFHCASHFYGFSTAQRVAGQATRLPLPLKTRLQQYASNHKEVFTKRLGNTCFPSDRGSLTGPKACLTCRLLTWPSQWLSHVQKWWTSQHHLISTHMSAKPYRGFIFTFFWAISFLVFSSCFFFFFSSIKWFSFFCC